MRRMSVTAQLILGVVCVGTVIDVATYDPTIPGGTSNLWLTGLLLLTAVAGVLLTVIASIRAFMSAARLQAWGWLPVLLVGLLAPIPVGFTLIQPLSDIYGANALQPFFPFCAGLVLTPMAALLYSYSYSYRARQAVSSSLP